VIAAGAHDIGGLQDFGQVPRTEEEHLPWHESVMRLLMSSGRFGLSRVSGETRYLVETLDPGEYRRLGYYERWVVAIAGLYSRLPSEPTAPSLAAATAMSSDESAAMYPGTHIPPAEAADRPFAVGAIVAVRAQPPAGHHRLPAYTWGHRGVIRGVYAPQEVPGCPLDRIRHEHVYNVAFTSDELWGDSGQDELRIDLFASYLAVTEDD
jgi:nitrile hydratase